MSLADLGARQSIRAAVPCLLQPLVAGLKTLKRVSEQRFLAYYSIINATSELESRVSEQRFLAYYSEGLEGLRARGRVSEQRFLAYYSPNL
jgi:hypothetical protein